MKRILLFLIFACSLPAYAQTSNGQATVAGATTLATCGTASVVTGSRGSIYMNTAGQLCVVGTFTATPSGTQDVNLKQIGGNALTTALPVSNATASNLKTAATLDAETSKVIGTVRMTGTAGETIYPDSNPCNGVVTTPFNVRLTSTTVTKIISSLSSNKNYICDFFALNAGATMERFLIIEGTNGGTECSSSPTEIFGDGTTSSAGVPLGANGGGVGSKATYPGTATAKDTCVVIQGVSNDTTVTGHYVQAP